MRGEIFGGLRKISLRDKKKGERESSCDKECADEDGRMWLNEDEACDCDRKSGGIDE